MIVEISKTVLHMIALYKKSRYDSVTQTVIIVDELGWWITEVTV